MKKISIIVLLSMLLMVLTSCSVILSSLSTQSDVERLGDWSFDYEEIPDYYVLYFGFKNKDGEYVASDADVDIHIVDDNKNELYNKTVSITKGNFVYKSSLFSDEKMLAEVRIKASDLKKGTSKDGVVYFTVHKNRSFSFNEQYTIAYNCLPTK